MKKKTATTDKELKRLDKYLKDAIADIALAIFKALILMGSNDKIKSSAIVFSREGDKINVELRIGAIEWYDGTGKKITFNDELIKSIGYVGGEDDQASD